MDRALRSMKSIANFGPAFHAFVQEECRLEASNIVEDKDDPKSSFTLETLRNFSYSESLQKFKRTNPVLVASIVGTLSKTRGTKCEDITRKGFGGLNRSENVDLTPTVVQSVSRILKNRHPGSVSVLPCLNSLHMWASRVAGHLFHFFNMLGDSYRFDFHLIWFGKRKSQTNVENKL